jgi:hypothetical protein
LAKTRKKSGTTSIIKHILSSFLGLTSLIPSSQETMQKMAENGILVAYPSLYLIYFYINLLPASSIKTNVMYY